MKQEPEAMKKMKFNKLLIGLLTLLILSSCSKDKDYVIYHRFPDHSWYRYNILQFEIPIEPSKESYDVYFFAVHSRKYSFENLDFNMIMTTPDGEERIREYHFPIRRKNGGFIGEFSGDTCSASIPLKKEIYFSSKGVLKIEIENLVPRLEIKGIMGAGIRLHPRR
jgi:gliding motility-associated lipoprotein GldH